MQLLERELQGRGRASEDERVALVRDIEHHAEQAVWGLGRDGREHDLADRDPREGGRLVDERERAVVVGRAEEIEIGVPELAGGSKELVIDRLIGGGGAVLG